jgi:cytochrome b561
MTQTYYPQDLRVAHWIVVFLVFFQYLTGPLISEAFDAGLAPGTQGTGTAIIHAAMGLSVLFVMIWRLRARRAQAVPPPPETEPPMIRALSRATHRAFYVFLIAMPVAGVFAILTGWGIIGWLHAIAAKILWLLILAHIAGAALHLIQRDGVMTRMTGHGAR